MLYMFIYIYIYTTAFLLHLIKAEKRTSKKKRGGETGDINYMKWEHWIWRESKTN